jgi:hypothetical protein
MASSSARPTPRAPGTCRACSKRSAAFVLDGLPRCLSCALRHPPLLRRSFATALVVGTVLTAINQGTTFVAGEFPASLYWKVPLTYCVPVFVTTWGGLINSRRRTEDETPE